MNLAEEDLALALAASPPVLLIALSLLIVACGLWRLLRPAPFAALGIGRVLAGLLGAAVAALPAAWCIRQLSERVALVRGEAAPGVLSLWMDEHALQLPLLAVAYTAVFAAVLVLPLALRAVALQRGTVFYMAFMGCALWGTTAFCMRFVPPLLLEGLPATPSGWANTATAAGFTMLLACLGFALGARLPLRRRATVTG
jgi:hypothetical protein